jgi:hypothetical protein
VQSIAMSAEHLRQFELEGKTFLEWTVTCDKTSSTTLLESRSSPAKWHHKGSLPLKIYKTHLPAGKNMASMFQDSEGVIHVDFIPHGVSILPATTRSATYCPT